MLALPLESPEIQKMVEGMFMLCSILFILCLGGLSNIESSRKGNFMGVCGMILAIASTTFLDTFYNQYAWFSILFAAGGAIGLILALRVEMIHMPELVAGLHSFVGVGATVVGFSSFYKEAGKESTVKEIEAYVGIFIGSVTFSGSIIAYLKLSASGSSKITQPMLCLGCFRHVLNIVIGLLIIFCGVEFCITSSPLWIYINTGLSILLGCHMILAIGASDIAVVISMLNSYSGWATSASGFLLNNNLLIITGALVGSSGAILSYFMCKAMNRSFVSVILGGFGNSNKKVERDPNAKVTFNTIIPKDAAQLIKCSKSIIIVPGYGLAASRSHFALSSLVKTIKAMGKSLKFCIHPVAGRMPGHMNTLLAEAKIPYNIVYEMKDVNEIFAQTDLVLVMGANDTVNPDSNNPSSPIAGMPVCEVWKAKKIIVMKRSLENKGFANIENPLFYYDNTEMLLKDMNGNIDTINEILSKGKVVNAEQVSIRKNSGDMEIERVVVPDKIYKTIGFVAESEPNEKRVAIIPKLVSKYRAMGFDVYIEPKAGENAGYMDEDYINRGAKVTKDVWKNSDILVKIKPPNETVEIPLLKESTHLELLVSYIFPEKNKFLLDVFNDTNISVLALEQIPRNTKGQKLDTLSSMTKIIGYRGVIEAVSLLPKYAMDQITSAGKIEGAKVYVIGAGVAGLAAISLARNIGCRVKCLEARKEGMENALSLGAEASVPDVVEDASGLGGYAKDLSEQAKISQLELLARELPKCDIVITTAQIPGKEAPKLISKEIVRKMKPGSIIVDLAAETGGNCELTKKGELYIDDTSRVIILGYTNWPSRMPQQSSELFSMNIFNLIEEMCTQKDKPKNAESFHMSLVDELISEPLIIRQGKAFYKSYEQKMLDAKSAKEAAKKEPIAKKKEETKVAVGIPSIEEVDTNEPKSGSVNVLSNLSIILISASLFLLLSYCTSNEFFLSFSLFILSIFIGYMVIWNVDKALHTPLMSETNAISGIILVGAMLQISGGFTMAKIYGMVGVFFASINVIGGFVVTHRVLSMFQK